MLKPFIDIRRLTIYKPSMNPMQSPLIDPGSAGPDRMAAVWRQVAPLTAAALTAQAVIVLVGLVAPAPLLTAMLATVAFAGVWLAVSSRPGSGSRCGRPEPGLGLYAAGLIAVAAFLGIQVLAVVLGDGHIFYCEPAVPWRIEIAIFGSFAIAFLTSAAEARSRARLVYALTLIAFLWIAPFYGFFSGPIFLAVGLVANCPDRSLMSVPLVGLGMIVGEQLGNRLGTWLSTPARPHQQRGD